MGITHVATEVGAVLRCVCATAPQGPKSQGGVRNQNNSPHPQEDEGER
jgi:hypothetical protein